jgi:hypothetical protein
MRSGHFWICKFGMVPGSITCVEKFELQAANTSDRSTGSPGTPTGTGPSSLNCGCIGLVTDDLSGLTLQEWDPSSGTDETSAPVTMLVNSNDLHSVNFPLTEVRPLHLDTVTRGDRRTCDVSVRNLQGVGNSTFVLSVENDNDFRSRCE